jgi:hypothetical protein
MSARSRSAQHYEQLLSEGSAVQLGGLLLRRSRVTGPLHRVCVFERAHWVLVSLDARLELGEVLLVALAIGAQIRPARFGSCFPGF